MQYVRNIVAQVIGIEPRQAAIYLDHRHSDAEMGKLLDAARTVTNVTAAEGTDPQTILLTFSPLVENYDDAVQTILELCNRHQLHLRHSQDLTDGRKTQRVLNELLRQALSAEWPTHLLWDNEPEPTRCDPMAHKPEDDEDGPVMPHAYHAFTTGGPAVGDGPLPSDIISESLAATPKELLGDMFGLAADLAGPVIAKVTSDRTGGKAYIAQARQRAERARRAAMAAMPRQTFGRGLFPKPPMFDRGRTFQVVMADLHRQLLLKTAINVFGIIVHSMAEDLVATLAPTAQDAADDAVKATETDKRD